MREASTFAAAVFFFVSFIVSLELSMSSSSSTTELHTTTDRIIAPNQPSLQGFPKQSYGQINPEKRSFQAAWFKTWNWLHYNEACDLVLCNTCVNARIEGNVSNCGHSDSHTTFTT